MLSTVVPVDVNRSDAELLILLKHLKITLPVGPFSFYGLGDFLFEVIYSSSKQCIIL